MKIPPSNAVISKIKANGIFRRVLARSLRIRAGDTIELFGSRISVDPRWELGYALAARQQNLTFAIQNDAPVLISLASLLSSGDTFLDVGANVGLYTSVLSRVRAICPTINLAKVALIVGATPENIMLAGPTVKDAPHHASVPGFVDTGFPGRCHICRQTEPHMSICGSQQPTQR